MPKPKKNNKKQSKNQQLKQKRQEDKVQRRSQKRQYQRGVAKNLKGYQKHFNEFQDELKELGLHIRDVEGDGNCMFRSISDIMEGDEKFHLKYRKLAVEYLTEHKDFYAMFIEDDMTFDQYLLDMSKNGEWGGHHELQALTNVLKVNFFIHMKGRPAMIISSMSDGMSRVESLKMKKSIHLAYHLVEDIAEHYSSVRLLDDVQNKPAETIPLDLLGMDINDIPDFRLEEDGDSESDDNSSQSSEQEVESKSTNNGRNKKCKCGSKLVFKKCCALKDSAKPKQQQQTQVVFL